MPEKPSARFVRPGEMLAFDARSLHSGPQGFFWLFGGGVQVNERRGDVAIVHIRGGLEHHSEYYSDSYEAIVQRYEAAVSGTDAQAAHERQHRYDDDFTPIDATPPAAVVFCIDSGGGAVAGLFEGVREIGAIRKKSGIPLVAYVNEMAASAAYAIACACDEIVCPATSAILGSVGAIATMSSQSEAEKKAGLDYRLITSGARKADGNPHAPISDEAISEEQSRVDTVAAAFWRFVAKSRGMSVKKVRNLEAGIMLGERAVETGLADEVATLDDVVTALSGANEKKDLDVSGGSVSSKESELRHGASSKVELPGDPRMNLKLVAERKKLEAKIEGEKDPKKKVTLAAVLEAYKKVEKHTEHVKSEEYDDDDEDDKDEDKDDDDEDDKDEDKAKKAAKTEGDDDDVDAAAKPAKGKAKASLDVADLAATIGVPAASLTPGALKAAFEKASQFDALSADVAALKATQAKATKNAVIDEAVAQRRITRTQANDLRGKKLSFVTDYLSMHKAALVNIDEDALLVPDGTPAGDVPANVKAIVEQSIAARGLDGEAAKKYRESSYAAHRESAAKSGGMH